jgi:homoserine dehydrogenase
MSQRVRKINMKHFNLCLLGFGNVGRALAALLDLKREELRERYGIEWRVTGVATRRLGFHVAPEGFETSELASGELRRRVSKPPADIHDWLEAARCDVLFETTSLEPYTGEPAVSHVRAGLGAGAHVVTANKGTIVHAYRELRELARDSGRRFLFEATVSDCPVFSLFREALPCVRLQSFGGVLNSTTNVILEEIESGGTFDEGVRRAQSLGVTETDPAHDVDGWDSAVKTCAVANVLMEAQLKLEDVRREGIGALSAGEVRAARAEGRPYRLVARARRDGDGNVSATVGPERVGSSEPFALASGTSLVLHFQLDVLPGLTLIAHTPDLQSTAYGLFADFINLVRDEQKAEGGNGKR